MARKPKTIRDVDDAIARWTTRLRRALTKLDGLNVQKRRMIKAAALAPRPAMPPVTMIAVAAPEPVTVPAKSEPVTAPTGGDGGLEIPAWLKRGGKSPADLKALEEIAADKERRAKAKREAKTMVKPSKKLGVDSKKMPLSGRAALDMIKNG